MQQLKCRGGLASPCKPCPRHRQPLTHSRARGHVPSALQTADLCTWKDGVAREVMRVRDYELDQFGVVNNAVYASYFQHCRHEALAAMGFNVDESARSGTPLALSELQLTFRAPLRSRDLFEVSCWVEKVGGARLILGQAIRLVASDTQDSQQQQGQLIASAVATVVWLDSTYRPTRVPAPVKAIMQELLDARAAAKTAVM